MSMTMRVSLPGYNALTDGTIDHYSIYSDSDNVLVKEYIRGGTVISGGPGSAVITHNFGYIPFFLAYVNDQTIPPYGWKQIGWANFTAAYLAYAGTANITLLNGSGTNADFKYYIFYDNQQA